MCEPFFGWSNRETWCMALHLSNEQQTDYDIADRAAHAGSVYSLADQIRDYFDDMEEWAPEHHRFIRDDVGSLYRVDWLEIARHYWADYGIEDEGEARLDERADSVLSVVDLHHSTTDFDRVAVYASIRDYLAQGMPDDVVTDRVIDEITAIAGGGDD